MGNKVYGYGSQIVLVEEATYGVPITTDEVQSLTKVGNAAVSGHYKLGLDGVKTDFIAWNATADDILDAVQLAWGPDSVSATDGTVNGGPIHIDFGGDYAGVDVSLITFSDNTMVDGGAAPVTLTPSETTKGSIDGVFKEFTDENIAFKQTALAQPTTFRVSQEHNVRSKASIEGPVTLQGQFNGFITLLKHAFGAVESTEIGSSGVWEHDFTLTDALPAGLTVYLKPGDGNYGKWFRYCGMKQDKLSITQDSEKFLTFVPDFIGKDLAKVFGPNFIDPPYEFNQIDYEMLTSLTLNGSAIKGRMTEFVLENSIDKEDYVLGSNKRDGAGRGSYRKVTGKILVDLDGDEIYALYTNLTPTKIVATWEGGAIFGNPDKFTFKITCTKCKFSGTTPAIKGAGLITMELPFEAYFDPEDGGNEIYAYLKNDQETDLADIVAP